MRYFLSRLLLLSILAATVYGAEEVVTRYFGDQTLAPLLSVLCCAFLALLGSPRLILAAIPLFAVLSYLLIMDASKYPLIRTMTMVLGGLLAYWACRQRQSLEVKISEVDMILAKIETPWILCDRSGNIRRMSPLASRLVQASLKDLEGTSFFSKLTGGPSRGELIQKFLRAADSRVAVEKVGLNPLGQDGYYKDASFIPVETKEGTGILVILSPSPASFPS